MSRRQRLVGTAAVAGLLAASAALAVFALRDNLVFFHTPTQLLESPPRAGAPLRIGGVVEPGSVSREHGSLEVRFVVADGAHRVPVVYRGLLPDLFREDRGVVAAGALGEDGVFRAAQVLAKHDENYIAPGTDAGRAQRPAWVVER
jgi:cytochrome c-type biogenesis protein CcmE